MGTPAGRMTNAEGDQIVGSPWRRVNTELDVGLLMDVKKPRSVKANVPTLCACPIVGKLYGRQGIV